VVSSLAVDTRGGRLANGRGGGAGVRRTIC
jgi:hypothetical protein